VLRERLLAELTTLKSADEAAAWAKTTLPLKNRLTAEDARRLELGFALALSGFEPAQKDHDDQATRKLSDSPLPARHAQGGGDRSAPLRRPVPLKAIRLRDPEHRKFVARQPCLICGRQPCDAHHLRFAQPRGLGLKVSDEFTVPLCRTHHRELHQTGREEAWWTVRKVDALDKAAQLWRQTRSSTEHGPV
jgi:hypothetical protein